MLVLPKNVEDVANSRKVQYTCEIIERKDLNETIRSRKEEAKMSIPRVEPPSK